MKRDSGRRKGDDRAFIHDPSKRLRLWPAKGYPFRWQPKHGEPGCFGESVTQALWRHRIALYIAVVVTLTLAVQIWNPHFFGEAFV